jgi:diguanylate cyclase (GGDEF)-like protein
MSELQPLMLAAPKLDDEVGRLAALYRYDILDTGSEAEFEQIVQLVQRVFDVPMAAVTLIDTDRQWFKARRGIADAETPRNIAFCHHTIAAADGLAVEDAEADPRFASSPLVAGAPHIRSYLGAPLRTPDGYQVGALCIIGNERRAFSLEDREILRRFSDVVVSQMELRQLASRDSLTGALTRRAFDQAMFDALEVERKTQHGAALAILDLDYFKRLNDEYGHGCGDAVLVAVTEAMQAVLGPRGIVGRLGGEEFGVLIDSGDTGTASALAERLRAAVAAVAVPGHDVHATASIGVALLSPELDSAEAWLHAADTALYAAKAGGRDRVALRKLR